ncbi:MAG TPA: hypothetical protein VL442_19185 [Mucilaginibacter sp.]|jgi:hypothetical protein|nr:hypothetical protein [Mucilaginibacter sp.]
MGTWNTKIDGNDTFQDIYQNFFDLYNQGENPESISQKILEDFADQFEDYEDRNNSLFGLAFAQWETKSLSSEILTQVKQIIENGKDLELWKELGADEKTLKQRKIVLDKFLMQISIDRKKAKKTTKPKSNYEYITFIDIMAPDLQKTFTVSEIYNNKQYVHTWGTVKWDERVRPVLIYNGQGKKILAEWTGNQTLKIGHDSSVNIIPWDDPVPRGKEDITVIYIEI